jgi:antitoxin component YwqK of YwqJK toxin-antitoxin module
MLKLGFLITFFANVVVLSQDTLSCKTDLAWDANQKFYYKKLDPTKARYSGPAKCYPQKGVENRGTLLNGNWEGKVFGYKGNILLGYSTFKDGYFDGPSIKYFPMEEGRLLVRDSMVYEKGKLSYSKVIFLNKLKDGIEFTDEVIYSGDTIIYKTTTYDISNTASELVIKRKLNGKKEGLQESYFLIENTKKELDKECYFYEVYKNGVLAYERKYDAGIYDSEKFYENGKLVLVKTYFGPNILETETPFLNGKKHGEVKHYEVDGTLISIDYYVKGKLVQK